MAMTSATRMLMLGFLGVLAENPSTRGLTGDAPNRETCRASCSTHDHHQQGVAVQLRTGNQAAHGVVIEPRSAGVVFGVRVPLAQVQQPPLVSVFDRALGGSGVGTVAIPGALVAGIRAGGLGHADLCGIESAEQLAASLGRPRGGLTVSADVLQGQSFNRKSLRGVGEMSDD